MARGLFTIQNYTPLKLIYHLLNCKNCLTTIKNYTPLKPVTQSDAQNIRLTTIKNYIPIKRSAKFWLIIISFKPI